MKGRGYDAAKSRGEKTRFSRDFGTVSTRRSPPPILPTHENISPTNVNESDANNSTTASPSSNRSPRSRSSSFCEHSIFQIAPIRIYMVSIYMRCKVSVESSRNDITNIFHVAFQSQTIQSTFFSFPSLDVDDATAYLIKAYIRSRYAYNRINCF